MDLAEFQKAWVDTPEFHKQVKESFDAKVNTNTDLKLHRDFVELNVFGFGERCFQWMHKIIVDELPKEFTFLEIGVFKGQILSLYELLAKMIGKKAKRYGVTPLNTAGGVWESDYRQDIEFIHEMFLLDKDYEILQGLSTDPEIIQRAKELSVDVLYIDGGHDYETVISDLTNYITILKPGGFLIVDDCCNDLHMPFGYFTGIEEVTRATNEVMRTQPDFEFLFSVVHNKVWRRKI